MARMDTSDGAGNGGVSASVNGRVWVNQILETNSVPVIWVTNRIAQIDPAFRRRFQHHLELKSPPLGAREALGVPALRNVKVGEGFAARLAVDETENASDTVVDNSANPVEALIERQIGNPDKALGTASKEHGARRVVTHTTTAWSTPSHVLRCQKLWKRGAA